MTNIISIAMLIETLMDKKRSIEDKLEEMDASIELGYITYEDAYKLAVRYFFEK